MRVLILTKIFPNRVEPLSCPFNRQQFAALARRSDADVEVVAAIPWFPGAKAFSRWSRAGRLLDVPSEDRIDGLLVRHPRFAFVPKLASLTGPLYAASLAGMALEYRGKVDVVLGSWAYPDGFAAVALSEMIGAPAVVKLHGSDMNVVARMPGPRRALEWALPRAARVVAVSRQLGDAAVLLGAPADAVDLVPNGLDRGTFRPESRSLAKAVLRLPAGGSIVLYVGNIERHKGCFDLIEAFGTLSESRKDVTLIMVGSGSAAQECVRIAAERRLNVVFTGALPHEELPRWMAASDLLALPSWDEGTPNVVLEALACGRRVVATGVGGTPDVVRSEVLGRLVPPREPAELARAIGEELERTYDPELVSRTLSVPDWDESARLLHSSLVAAVASRHRKVAA